MKRFPILSSNVILSVIACAVSAYAASEGSTAPVILSMKEGGASFFTGINLAAVLGLTIAVFGCGLAQGNAVAKAVEGIARQPEASNKIQTALLIGLAFIESLVIYVLVFGLILLFANPYSAYFIGK